MTNQPTGIDVSHHNQNINWQQVCDLGHRFAYARASQGRVVDSLVEQHIAGIRDTKLLLGLYHILRPDIDVDAQIAAFRNLYDTTLVELPPVLDVEHIEGYEVPTQELVQTFLTRFYSLTGRRLMVYTSPGFWNAYMRGVNVEGHPLWVAHWGVDAPQLPNGWETWTFWQRRNNYQIPGHAGPLDLDVFNGDEAALRAYAGLDEEEPDAPDDLAAQVVSLEARMPLVEDRLTALDTSVGVNRDALHDHEERLQALESAEGTEIPGEAPETPEEPPGAADGGEILRVTAINGLNFRTEPELGSQYIIRGLAYGEKVEYLGEIEGATVLGNDLWLWVRDQNGFEGYAHSLYLTSSEPQGSKLGVGRNAPHSQDVLFDGITRFARFNLTLGGDNFFELDRYLKANPDATAIARCYELEVTDVAGDPEYRGRLHWQMTKEHIASRIDPAFFDRVYFKGINERDTRVEAWFWNRFEAARTYAAAEDGCHIAGLSAGVGRPGYDEWGAFSDMLRALGETGGLLDLHAYCGKHVNDLFVPGSGTLPETGYTHLALRYRWVHDNVYSGKQAAGECLIDKMGHNPDGSEQVPGSDSWRRQNMSEEDHLAELMLFKQCIDCDDYFLGAAIFLLGCQDIKWQFHSIQGSMAVKLANALA